MQSQVSNLDFIVQGKTLFRTYLFCIILNPLYRNIFCILISSMGGLNYIRSLANTSRKQALDTYWKQALVE